MRYATVGWLTATLLASPALAAAADPGAVPQAPYSYVELVRMALAAKTVLAADVAEAIPLKGASAADVPGGTTRFYVRADVRGLISGAGVPAQVSYLVDVPDDQRGRRPKLKGMPVLLLATQGANPGELRLVGPRGQLARTAENEQRLRAILTEAVSPDAPPAITGVTRAFHVAGSLPGESETQIFLRTADQRPISLSVLRRPNEDPRWVVALSELVDDSAAPPKRESLLWYRLACGLPDRLPDRAIAGLASEDADAARADYQLVLRDLGSCSS